MGHLGFVTNLVFSVSISMLFMQYSFNAKISACSQVHKYFVNSTLFNCQYYSFAAYRMNAAIRKGTWQPSKKSSILMSANAIDGDKNPSLKTDSSVYTQKGKNRWWAVNLERRYEIVTVVVTMATTGSKSTLCISKTLQGLSQYGNITCIVDT